MNVCVAHRVGLGVQEKGFVRAQWEMFAGKSINYANRPCLTTGMIRLLS